MTYIITSLCLRDSGCVDVCPVECIVPGKPARTVALVLHRPRYLHRLRGLHPGMPI